MWFIPVTYSSSSSVSEFVAIAAVSNISLPRPHKAKDLALRPKRAMRLSVQQVKNKPIDLY